MPLNVEEIGPGGSAPEVVAIQIASSSFAADVEFSAGTLPAWVSLFDPGAGYNARFTLLAGTYLVVFTANADTVTGVGEKTLSLYPDVATSTLVNAPDPITLAWRPQATNTGHTVWAISQQTTVMPVVIPAGLHGDFEINGNGVGADIQGSVYLTKLG